MGRLKLKALAVIAVLFVAPPAAAQTVGVPLQMRTGDMFTVSVEYTQTAEIGGEDLNATMSYVYSVQVLDAETRLWRFMPISVAYEMPEMPGIEAQAANINWVAASDVMSAMMRIATDVGFECRVDEHGRCNEMTNWPFWSARVENMALAFDGIARMMPTPPSALAPAAAETPAGPHPKGGEQALMQANVPPRTPTWEEVRVPVLQGVARLIDSIDARDAAAALSSAYYPATVQGRTLTRRQTVPFTEAFEMPFGAPALQFSGTLRLDSINQRDNTAIVTRRATLDQQSARNALTAMTTFVSAAVIEPMSPQLAEGQRPPEGAALAEMVNSMLADLAYQETTRGVIDLSTGMARETTTDYTMSVRMMASEEPVEMRGRVVTRVTPSAPETPRLPRG